MQRILTILLLLALMLSASLAMAQKSQMITTDLETYLNGKFEIVNNNLRTMSESNAEFKESVKKYMDTTDAKIAENQKCIADLRAWNTVILSILGVSGLGTAGVYVRSKFKDNGIPPAPQQI